MKKDKDDPESAESYGGAGRFMLAWALAFYTEYHDDDAGDRHLTIAVRCIRDAAHRANLRLNAATEG